MAGSDMKAVMLSTARPIIDSSPSATNLNDQIHEFVKNMAANAPPGVVASLNAEIQKLAESGITDHVLKVGGKAPDFSLPNARGGMLQLSLLLSKGPVVVTFYRGGWCPFCNLTLRAYESIYSEIRRLGAELVAISPQTPDNSLSDVEKKGLAYPVLSDVHLRVTRQYGLVFKLTDTWKKLQEGFGNPLPKFNGDESWELPIPGTFVLDRGGVVRLAFVDPDYMRRLEPASILNALREARA
jgi:peroxiredoxin